MIFDSDLIWDVNSYHMDGSSLEIGIFMVTVFGCIKLHVIVHYSLVLIIV